MLIFRIFIFYCILISCSSFLDNLVSKFKSAITRKNTSSIIKDYTLLSLKITQSLSNTIPKDLLKIIIDYSINDQLPINLLDRVMNTLKVSAKRKREIKFHNAEFAQRLFNILNNIDPLKIKDYYLQIDIGRLVYKWIFYLKSEYGNGFEVQIIPQITPTWKKLNDILDPSILVNVETLKTLDKCKCWPKDGIVISEILDRGEDIFNLYDRMFKEFYHETGSCQVILNNYFGGYFNNDIILKFMISLQDSYGMMKKCLDDPTFKISPSKEDFPQRSTRLEIVKKFSYGFGYIDVSILNFYREHGFRFRIDDQQEYCIFVLNLIRIDQLNKETIRQIIGFPKEWNLELFKKYMVESRKCCKITYEKEIMAIILSDSKENNELKNI